MSQPPPIIICLLPSGLAQCSSTKFHRLLPLNRYSFRPATTGDATAAKFGRHYRAWSECEGKLELAVRHSPTAAGPDGQVSLNFAVALVCRETSSEETADEAHLAAAPEESEEDTARRQEREADRRTQRKHRQERAVRQAATGAYPLGHPLRNQGLSETSSGCDRAKDECVSRLGVRHSHTDITAPGAPQLCFAEPDLKIWAEWDGEGPTNSRRVLRHSIHFVLDRDNSSHRNVAGPFSTATVGDDADHEGCSAFMKPAGGAPCCFASSYTVHQSTLSHPGWFFRVRASAPQAINRSGIGSSTGGGGATAARWWMSPGHRSK